MSRNIGPDNSTEFALGEIVSFDHDGERLTGKVVRVYSTRLNYHIEVEGERYEVSVPEDDPGGWSDMAFTPENLVKILVQAMQPLHDHLPDHFAHEEALRCLSE